MGQNTDADTMHKIMSGFTLAHYFLSIISHHGTRTTQMFMFFDPDNDFPGAVT